MKRIDAEKAFGTIDPGFERRVRDTMASLRTKEEHPMRKIRVGLLIAVLLCVLMTGLALAASHNWRLLDFFAARQVDHMAPEAEEMIYEPTDQVQAKTEKMMATIAIRDVLFDGNRAEIVVNVAPADSYMLFLPPLIDLSDPLANLGSLYEDSDTTVGDYAEQKGITSVHELYWQFLDSPLEIHSIGHEIEEDGSMTYHLSASSEEPLPETMIISLSCRLFDFDTQEMREEIISFPLNWSPEQRDQPLFLSGPVIYDECGLRIDRMTLSPSPLSVQANIVFTVLDQAKYASLNEPRFAPMDENGNPIPMDLADWDDSAWGIMVGDIDSNTWWAEWEHRWTISTVLEGDEIDPAANEDMPVYTQYEQQTTIPAMDLLPDAILWAVYDSTNDRYHQPTAIQLTS